MENKKYEIKGEYFRTRNKYLACALGFLGHKWYRYDSEIGSGKMYSFKVSKNLIKNLNELRKMKDENK